MDVAPTGKGDTLVIVNAATTMVIAFVVVWVGMALSVIRTVKLNVPVVVVVPLMVATDNDNPFGSEPEMIDQT